MRREDGEIEENVTFSLCQRSTGYWVLSSLSCLSIANCTPVPSQFYTLLVTHSCPTSYITAGVVFQLVSNLYPTCAQLVPNLCAPCAHLVPTSCPLRTHLVPNLCLTYTQLLRFYSTALVPFFYPTCLHLHLTCTPVLSKPAARLRFPPPNFISPVPFQLRLRLLLRAQHVCR